MLWILSQRAEPGCLGEVNLSSEQLLSLLKGNPPMLCSCCLSAHCALLLPDGSCCSGAWSTGCWVTEGPGTTWTIRLSYLVSGTKNSKGSFCQYWVLDLKSLYLLVMRAQRFRESLLEWSRIACVHREVETGLGGGVIWALRDEERSLSSCSHF